jgi:hypothetical protein
MVRIILSLKQLAASAIETLDSRHLLTGDRFRFSTALANLHLFTLWIQLPPLLHHHHRLQPSITNQLYDSVENFSKRALLDKTTVSLRWKNVSALYQESDWVAGTNRPSPIFWFSATTCMMNCFLFAPGE